ncbi:class I adenylate-forming enzyme family protein [Sphingomonas lycopersici]|uniref:Acyl--CoA ligase n=1 Tax=Sphingomonas lycopersici TaxID=2951807 RepID=A0AA41ZBD0_9SPHN|nr:class I adenylate-forming enzyme family protein [Sphingomonas lycopersici]MCW6536935.1 acyl--CoA ligase [Sphingomonas lycopersici]
MPDDQPPAARISDFLFAHAETQPDAIAVVLDERRWTYAALAAAVDALATAMIAAGVARGDRVATLQTPHPDFLVALLATASIGGIWVGLNPRYQFAELRHVLEDAAPKLLLARSEVAGRRYERELVELRAAVPSIAQCIIFDGDPPVPGAVTMTDFLRGGTAVTSARLQAARAEVGGRMPCLIVYTSGSTGQPKGAVLHHAGINQFCVAQNRLWPLDPHRVVSYFPINHIGGVVDTVLPCIAAGGTIVFMEQFDPAGCLALMEREAVTLWISVPGVFRMQLDLPGFADIDLSAVQLIVWEGAEMPADLIAALLRICPRLATNYGMTETTSAITVVEPTDDIALLSGSVGHAFPCVEIRLTDAEGVAVADGIEGEVQARSALNLLGYWQRPEATAACFTPDGFFRTGDLAVRRPDGSYRLVGRLKEMYKSGGYNVYPREVETVLERHPAVALAAVVARPDPVWQEIGVAYVQSSDEVDAQALAAHCREHLANYKIPKIFVIERDLPTLPIGKIDKQELARRARLLAT